MTKNEFSIPEYLPKRLSIAMWIWSWATDRNKGEPFYDLEKCFKDLKDMGFNAVRMDALLSLAYDIEGKPRSPVEIVSPFNSYCSGNATPILDSKGGFSIDALKEVLHFFELAEKYDVYVALTSWDFQRNAGFLGFIADDKIRKECLDIPIQERLSYLAKQWDRIITEIKKQGFKNRIAYVELHNEIDQMYYGEGHLKNVERALSYLQEKHPDILFTDDRQVELPEPKDRDSYSFFDSKMADISINRHVKNTQALDHHLYVLGVQGRVFKELGFSIFCGIENESVFTVENLKRNEILRSILKPDAIPYEEFKKYYCMCDRWKDWWPTVYLYENMDVDGWDYLMFKYYPEYEKPMRYFWKNFIYCFSKEAIKRKVPLICDEGYIFFPPDNSNFETSAVGKKTFEFIVDHMLEANYWGIMVSSYTSPGNGLWERESEWLKNINKRIID